MNAVITADSIDDLCTQANIELDNLLQWYHCNGLSVNPSKSKAMIIKSKFNNLDLPIIHNDPFLPIYINMAASDEQYEEKRVPICLVPNSSEDTVRVLGILIDENLTLEHHAFALKSKLGKGIFSLNSLKGILGKEQQKMIYNAHFNSHLNYCSNILNLLPIFY